MVQGYYYIIKDKTHRGMPQSAQQKSQFLSLRTITGDYNGVERNFSLLKRCFPILHADFVVLNSELGRRVF